MRSIRIDTDLEFLDAPRRERLDLYRPRHGRAPWPSAIFLHGGAFHRGDKASERSRTLCRLLAQEGIAALSVNYRLSKSSLGDARWEAWPTNLLDAAAAVRFVCDQAQAYDLDPSRIAVVGTSAGGTLALLLAFGAADALGGGQVASRIKAVVNFYGRVDWTRNTVTRKIPSSPDIARDASPLTWIASSQTEPPSTLTFHGDDDQVVPVDQARLLDQALQERGAPHELTILPGAPHAFALEPAPEAIRDRLSEFLAARLKIDRQDADQPARSEP